VHVSVPRRSYFDQSSRRTELRSSLLQKKKPQVENAVRKPLNAGLLKEDTDPETLIKAIHELHPDAIITLASSVLTIMQGTLLWAGTFKPCWLARTLGPFTEHAKGPLIHFYTYP